MGESKWLPRESRQWILLGGGRMVRIDRVSDGEVFCVTWRGWCRDAVMSRMGVADMVVALAAWGHGLDQARLEALAR